MSRGSSDARSDQAPFRRHRTSRPVESRWCRVGCRGRGGVETFKRSRAVVRLRRGIEVANAKLVHELVDERGNSSACASEAGSTGRPTGERGARRRTSTGHNVHYRPSLQTSDQRTTSTWPSPAERLRLEVGGEIRQGRSNPFGVVAGTYPIRDVPCDDFNDRSLVDAPQCHSICIVPSRSGSSDSKSTSCTIRSPGSIRERSEHLSCPSSARSCPGSRKHRHTSARGGRSRHCACRTAQTGRASLLGATN